MWFNQHFEVNTLLWLNCTFYLWKRQLKNAIFYFRNSPALRFAFFAKNQVATFFSAANKYCQSYEALLFYAQYKKTRVLLNCTNCSFIVFEVPCWIVQIQKIGCSSSITSKITCSCSFDVWKNDVGVCSMSSLVNIAKALLGSMLVRSKQKIGCSSLINNRWTHLSSFDVRQNDVQVSSMSDFVNLAQ